MSPPRILAPSDFRRMPWKNGGGTTHEIAIEPPDAGLDTFTWRVSVAEVDRDGKFSSFPGIDRTLVLIAGQGMRLAGEGEPVDLHALYEPVTFAGEAVIDCTLAGGPARDFNLMVRRSLAAGTVVAVREESKAMLPASAYVCYAAAGICECLLAGYPPFEVAPEHALLVGREAATGMHVNPRSAQSVALVAAVSITTGGAQP